MVLIPKRNIFAVKLKKNLLEPNDISYDIIQGQKGSTILFSEHCDTSTDISLYSPMSQFNEKSFNVLSQDKGIGILLKHMHVTNDQTTDVTSKNDCDEENVQCQYLEN